MGTATATGRRSARAPAPVPTVFTAPVTPEGLVVLDAGQRTYMGQSRSGGQPHVIQAAAAHHPRVHADRARVGDLVCGCEGGTFNGECWRLEQARAFEDETFWRSALGGTDPKAARS